MIVVLIMMMRSDGAEENGDVDDDDVPGDEAAYCYLKLKKNMMMTKVIFDDMEADDGGVCLSVFNVFCFDCVCVVSVV